ncbi:Mariner Mos1 transposase like protein [Argiope bruennichi]|uniref:Mariner Mos1 transposase like protein n=1 Tax=Argiope bruennichi TaxID=94029 RepID=A0A8T0E7L6_ARGBR|nr:Mariner Mos1 transposase like protein [Argiope bruennichi]
MQGNFAVSKLHEMHSIKVQLQNFGYSHSYDNECQVFRRIELPVTEELADASAVAIAISFTIIRSIARRPFPRELGSSNLLIMPLHAFTDMRPFQAPADCHINRTLEHWQASKVYDDIDNLVADVKAWIASKDCEFFASGIDGLPSKWEAVIEVGGDYAPDKPFKNVKRINLIKSLENGIMGRSSWILIRLT